MPLLYSDAAAWGCVLAGLALHAVALAPAFRKSGKRFAFLLPLPGLCALLLARFGYLLLQSQEELSLFRWCFTLGLAGLVLGTLLAARLLRTPALPVLDSSAWGLCAAMALARFSQRWLGEVGTGPYLDEGTLLCRPPFILLNEWEEPLLALFLLEALCAALAVIPVLLSARHAAPGTVAARALFLLLIPQILLEQFRTGHYMRWRMLRLEQVVCAVFGLIVLVLLCREARKSRGFSPAAAWLPVPLYLLAVGVIVVIQFVLDGKLFELPEAVSWCIYVLAVAGMLGIGLVAARRLNSVHAEGTRA